MHLPAIDSAGPFTMASVACAVFLLLLFLARLFQRMKRAMTGRFKQRVPAPTAALLAVLVSALIFWNVGNGLLVQSVLRMMDRSYSELDARLEEERPRPTAALKTGGPDSLLKWSTLGRQGRRMVADGPDQAQIQAMTGRTAQEHIQLKLLEVAKERVLDPSHTIAEVAYALGFQYPQHFTRMFKKVTGLTPHEYRTPV